MFLAFRLRKLIDNLRRPEASEQAVAGLVEIGSRAVLPLCGALEKTSGSNVHDYHFRRSAAKALGEIRDIHAIPCLLSLLGDDPRFYSHGNARNALAKIGAPAVTPLIAALDDNNNNVREGAAGVLAIIKDRRAVEPLITLLGDTLSDVRLAAVQALGDIGDSRAVAPLILALADEKTHICNSAIHALAKIGDGCAAEPICTMLKQRLKQAREKGQQKRSRDATPARTAHTSILNEPSIWYPAFIDHLWRLGEGAVIPLLQLAQDNQEVARDALKSLQRLLEQSGASIAERDLRQIFTMADVSSYEITSLPLDWDAPATRKVIVRDCSVLRELAKQELARRGHAV